MKIKRYFTDAYSHNPTIVEEEKDSIIKFVAIKLKKKREDIVRCSAEETGIPVRHLYKEFDHTINAIKKIPELYRTAENTLELYCNKYSIKYRLVPKGRVLIFTPWNTPILSQLFLPCLSYYLGNVTIIKPSSRASSTSLFLDNIINNKVRPCGKTHRRLYLLLGSGKEIASEINETWLDYVYYMGARVAGMEIRRKFTGDFHGEFEGNDIGVITDYKKSFIEYIIDSAFSKNGLDCDNLRGIFVHAGIYERVLKELRIKTTHLKVGVATEKSTEINKALFGALQISTNPDENEIIHPKLASGLWVKKYENDVELKNNLLKFFKKSRYGLSFLLLSTKNHDRWINYLVNNTKITRICVNKALSDFCAYSPWGGRGLTSFNGSVHWVNKFSDVISIEKYRKLNS